MAWLFIPIVVSNEMWLRSASDKRGGLSEPAEDRLHHDHGGIDDQAEIDRADRQQIGGFAAQDENDDGEKQRERNRRADDQRASEIAEEYPLQQHDQDDPDHHVVQHRVGGDVDQILAVVDPLDLTPGGRIEELLMSWTSFSTRAIVGELCSPRRISTMPCTMSSSWSRPAMPSRGFSPIVTCGDVANQNRIAARLRQHGVVQIVDRADQADAAHHGGLRADIDGVAADIDVGVGDGLQHLRQRQPVGDQLVEVDLQFIGLGLAAPAGDVDHAGHGAEAALQYPVLQRLEVEDAVVRRSLQPVAKDFAGRAQRRNARLRAARQRRELRQPVQHLLQRLFIGVIEGELQLDVGQSVQRDGADGAQVLDAGDLGLDRDRDVALDLLRRQPRALRHDVDHRRGRVGIGLDVELLECDQAADDHGDEHGNHQIAAADC